MNDEKRKNDEKRYETEWSFSFENIGRKIDEAFASAGEEIRYDSFSAAIDGAKTARIKLAGCLGRLNIRALENSDKLFEAETAYTGELEFTITDSPKEGERIITLRPKNNRHILGPVRQAFGAIGKRDELYWNVAINPNIPVYLDLDGIVGPSDADLTGFTLTRLDLDGNVGPSTLHLPESAYPYDIKLNGVVGQTNLNAAATKGVRLEANGVVGQTTIRIPANAAMSIKINGNVGQTTINAAPELAVRLTANGGIGGLHVPKGLNKIKSGGDFVTKSGVWESEGFALTDQQVIVQYDGGVGSLRINQEEVQIV